ncbi:MAG TPA: C4-type zinc ribbon domain-containing protein [Bryobacteraceae bacterium]|jgi:predicted  nucleic acid-binding Zn-ribbon protein|nr:C4-type zinc ribbon domain-containing protein [Bryobacteraceae bacterium]
MLQDLALALRLQALDRTLAHLANEIATLPKHIAEIEKKLDTHTRRLEADRAALSANQRDRKKLEGDIQIQEQKISKLRDQMLGAKTNEQYRAFQNEISYAENEIRKAEDKILDLMEQSEPLEKNVKAAEVELKNQQQHVEAEKKRAQERTALDQKQLAEKQAERQSVAAQMDQKFYAEYERIRKKTKNTPIADATEGRCDACQITLRPQFFQDLRRGDKIMFCESCGRILTYNPVVDVASDVAASQQTA